MNWLPSQIKNLMDLYLELDRSNNGPVKTGITDLNQRLSTIKDHILQREITPRELKVSCQLIHKCLNLIPNTNEGLTFKEKCSSLLDTIQHMAQVQLTDKPAVASTSESVKECEPVLNLVILCDIDVKDHNSAISKLIKGTTSEKIPFIASKSILCGINLSENFHIRGEIKASIFQDYMNWTLYKKGEIILFIPKSYPVKVEALGFDMGDLEEIKHIKEIFEGPIGNPKLEDILSFLNTSIKKRIILDGHGDDSYIGGLNLEHYHKFVECLSKSKGESLEVISCQSGGISSLEHYYFETKHVDESPPDGKKITLMKKTQPPFPILVRSIGSFAIHDNDCRYKDHFRHLDTWLNKKGSYTVPKLQDLFHSLSLADIRLRDFKHNLQVKFPHSSDVPGGFRPLGETPDVQILTYAGLRTLELAKIDHLTIKQKKIIEILPLRVNLPLHITYHPSLSTTPFDFQEKEISSKVDVSSDAPLLLSMIPGRAHHLIDQITVEDFTLLDLFVNNARTYRECEVTKTFFIGKMAHKNGLKMQIEAKAEQSLTKNNEDPLYSKIALEFTPTASHMYFASGCQEQETYWHYELDLANKKIIKTQLSESEFCFAIVNTAQNSNATLEAVRSSSGGQESEKKFYQDLLFQVFWESEFAGNRPLPKDFALYFRYNENPSLIKAEELFNNLDSNFHFFILLEAIRNNDKDLSHVFLSKGKIDLNQRDYGERTPLFLAIVYQREEIVKQLINGGADPNKTSLSDCLTPLMLATSCDLGDIVKILLEKISNIDFEIQNSKGWNTLLYCCEREIFTLVFETIKKRLHQKNNLEKDALEEAFKNYLNHTTKNGHTLLSYLTFLREKEKIELLLNEGADPNKGNPPPLSQAICQHNKEMVAFWLDKNVEVFKPDSQGKSSLEYACLRSTPDILELLLKKVDIANSPQAPNLLVKTLRDGYSTNAMLLWKAGIKMDSIINDSDSLSFYNLCYNLFRYQEIDFINQLLLESGDAIQNYMQKCYMITPDSLEIIFEFCLNHPSDAGIKCFLKLFAPQLKNSDLSDNALLEKAYDSGNSDKLICLLQSGINPCNMKNIYEYEKSFLEIIIEKGDLNALQICINHSKSVDLNKKINEKNLLVFAYQNQPDLFKCLLQNGVVDPTYKSYDYPQSVLEKIIDAQDEKALNLCLSVKGWDLNRHPLLLQALEKSPKMFKKLVEYGADLTLPRYDSPIKKLIQGPNDPEILDFSLSHLKTEDKQALLEREADLLQLYRDQKMDLFNILLKHGADPIRRAYSTPPSLFYHLLSHPDTELLQLILSKICPEKDGKNLPMELILDAIRTDELDPVSLQVLIKYGFQFINSSYAKEVDE